MFFVTGDIHGSVNDFLFRLNDLEDALGRSLTNDDEVLLLGDVGLRYGAWAYDDLLDADRKSVV